MTELFLKDRTINTKQAAFVMGIVNCTPDSFFDKSRGGASEAIELIEQGADILDIGGESTRPGSDYVEEAEEIKRIIPVIEEIRRKSDIPISVDTRKFAVMKAAYEAGADILNDISALEDDPKLAEFAAKEQIPVILMHKRGIPQTMQSNTNYENAFLEVNSYLESRVSFAKSAGIQEQKIIVDPGIGFGKGTEANLSLIKNCGKLCQGKYQVLMALSRKTCIGDITGRPIHDRLTGTIAANLIAIQNGASIIRVHDVKEHVDMIKILSAL